MSALILIGFAIELVISLKHVKQSVSGTCNALKPPWSLRIIMLRQKNLLATIC